ncbi:MAG: lactonase family protein [Gammaproteobacteria bacterium]|nr:lactonase family protein [Gammaproteobacteria bacterium]
MALHKLLIGTYTHREPDGSRREAEGIYWAEFDDATGAFRCLSLATQSASPAFLARHGDRLYAVNEVEEGAVSAFRLADGRIQLVAQQSSRGAHPCHIAATRHWVAVANYTSGSVALFSPDLEPTDFIEHRGHGPNTRRQQRPHAHQVLIASDQTNVLVPDLGNDHLYCYRIDQHGVAQPDPRRTPIAPGSGPRHAVFHPSMPVVYLINELANTIDVLAFNDSAPKRCLQTVTTLPKEMPEHFAGRSSTAELAISANGRHVYGTNRGHDSVATFSVDAEGMLTSAGHVPAGGEHPRYCCIDPSGGWLIIGNQNTDNVVVYRLHDGVPVELVCDTHAPTPVCFLFL